MERRQSLLVLVQNTRDGYPYKRLRQRYIALTGVSKNTWLNDADWLLGQPGIVEETRGRSRWIRYAGVRA